MKRGDIVTVAIPGDYGKPRPAVTIQSDLLIDSGAQSLLVCLITSWIEEVKTFRITLDPSPNNGLQKPSQIMVDKIFSANRQKVGPVIGFLSSDELSELNRKLAFVIGLA